MSSLFRYHNLRAKEEKRWKQQPPAESLASHSPRRVNWRTIRIDKLAPYDGQQNTEFVHVSSNKTDRATANLCKAYREGSDLERAFIRSKIDAKKSWVLLTFSKRAAVRGFQTHAIDCFRDSLAAHAIEDLAQGDVRDNLVALGLVYYCAAKVHDDPGTLFEDAATIASPAIAAVLRDFADRDDLDEILSAMGYEEVRLRGKTGFRHEK